MMNAFAEIYLCLRLASGIDLNCGCPQSDVRSKGYGSKLLDSPALIADIVKQTRARIADPDFSVSTKIRIQYPLERTVDLCCKVKPRCFFAANLCVYFSLKLPAFRILRFTRVQSLNAMKLQISLQLVL